MSVLTDPATYGPSQQRADELPTHRCSTGRNGSSMATYDGDASARNRKPCRFHPKSWSGNTPIGGLAREVAAWLGYVDPTHEAGKLIQRITKGTLRATEAWTDGRHAEDDKHVELDFELAVALANVTEGAARATVLRVTQAEPSHGFLARQALVDDSAPKSSNDPAKALQPTLATPKQMQGGKGIGGEAHSMIIDSGRVRASIGSDR